MKLIAVLHQSINQLINRKSISATHRTWPIWQMWKSTKYRKIVKLELKYVFLHASLSERAIDKGHSACLTVCASVHHTRHPRLNGSRYRNTLNTIRQSDVSSFLMSDFVFLSLGVQMC